MTRRIPLAVAVLAVGVSWTPPLRAAPPVFSGKVPNDFSTSQYGTVLVQEVVGDVGVPDTVAAVSGMDIQQIALHYDPTTDILYVGIQSAYGGEYGTVIAGDTDNNGDPGTTIPALEDSGGEDLPDFAGTEAFAIYFDTNRDGIPDAIAGDSDSTDIFDYTVAFYNPAINIKQPYKAFGNPLPIHLGIRPQSPSAAWPHLEFTVEHFSELPGFNFDRFLDTPIFGLGVYMGSQADAGIGEDYYPKATELHKDFTLASPTVTVAGQVFIDLNRDGTRDGGDTAYPSGTLTVTGDFDRNGQPDTRQLTSDANGGFSLPALAYGDYTVQLTVPFGYSVFQTNPARITLLPGQVSSLQFALQIKDSDGDSIIDLVEGETPDADDDDVPNYLEPDSDDDGIPDQVEAGPNPADPVDTDGDGDDDYTDTDSDNDSIPDEIEGTDDHDRDTVPNYLDTDSDNDGLPDGTEDADADGEVDEGETDALDGDTDDDGLSDGTEVNGYEPPGGGDPIVTDPLNPDSDEDDLQDGLEVGLGQAQSPDTDLEVFTPDTEPSTTTDPNDADTDDGGVQDGDEDVNDNGKVDEGEIDPNIGEDDVNLDTDWDDDGVPNEDEIDAGTDPNDPDTDDDGLGDGEEEYVDTDGDGDIDPLDFDSDDDGLPDGVESGLTEDDIGEGTDPDVFVPDADPETTTDPTDRDTDDDGILDGDEDADQDGATDPGETGADTPDSDGDGIQDGTEQGVTDEGADPDTDPGVFQPDEDPDSTTDPLDDDSDDDGRADGSEDGNHDGAVEDGESDPNNPDTDGDGLQDGTEVGLSQPEGEDTDENVFIPDSDPDSTTDPLDWDTDDGTVSDGDEDANHNGAIDEGERDPNYGPDDVPGDYYLRGGGGCSTSGSNHGSSFTLFALLAPLAFLRRRQLGVRLGRWFRALTALILVGAVAPASAQETASAGIESQQFHPSATSFDYLNTVSSRSPRKLGPMFGLWLDYGKSVLQLYNGDTLISEPISGAVGGHLIASMGFTDRIALGVNLPIVLKQWVEPLPDGTTLSETALGDFRLDLKLRVVGNGERGFGIALIPAMMIPSGSTQSFSSSGELNGSLLAVFDYQHERFGAAINVGYRFRPSPFDSYGLHVDDELVTRLGLRVNMGSGWGLIGELSGSNVLIGSTGLNGMPFEALAALQKQLSSGLVLTAGAGVGLTGGYGTPSWRGLLGVGWRPMGGSDRDGDGVTDRADRCPDEPEDRDGFEDSDGCPDLDNDRDGIPDASDRCANDPEDRDGFEDTDGCPDPDNDGDGIPDVSDRCPNDPEDRDGFEDADGCPDPDNDKDGIADRDDKCPNDPEDRDGFEDTDGCPETDNDKDGIVDREDKCPDQAEVVNNYEDTDGCPDVILNTTKIKVQGTRLVLLEKIYFKTDSHIIEPRSYPIMLEAVKVFKENPTLRVRIEGHTDDVASDEYNISLSQRRANSVKQFLVDRGIDTTRMETVGKGETEPVVPNTNDDNRQLNRRIEWVILE